MLRFLREQGCPWDIGTAHNAAHNGQLDTLKWAIANQCAVDETVMAQAATHGHLDVLKYLRVEQSCPWDATTMEHAAYGGAHLEVLEWLRESGCEWGKSFSDAAAGGHVAILEYLLDKGCPWTEDATTKAAEHGGGLYKLNTSSCPIA